MEGRTHIPRRVLVIAAAACIGAAGCRAQSPTAPDPAGAAAVLLPSDSPASYSAKTIAPQPLARARTSHTFDLLEGTVTLILADGSALLGTYRGNAVESSTGQRRATLDGTVSGGTGMLAGARGTLSGTGTGGFAGDGEFSVALRAAIATAGGVPLDLRVTLRGVSNSTCTTTAPPRMSLVGAGTAKGYGPVTGQLEHNLGSQICAIIVE